MYQINNIITHLKLLEKQEQTIPQTSRQREITKIRAEINELMTKIITQRINNNNKKELVL
jgi:hypothetical protein